MLLEDNASTEPFFRCCLLSRDFSHTLTNLDTNTHTKPTHPPPSSNTNVEALPGKRNKKWGERRKFRKKGKLLCFVRVEPRVEALFFDAVADFERLSKCFHGSLASISVPHPTPAMSVPRSCFGPRFRIIFDFVTGRGVEREDFLNFVLLKKD